MLSSRSAVDAGAPPRPSTRPPPAGACIQGLDKVHLDDSYSPRSHIHDLPETSSISPSPSSSSSPARRRDSHFINVDSGSPKHRSPLRHSISYADTNNDTLSPTRSLWTSKDPWNNRPASVDMSFTGDKKNRRNPDGSPQARAPQWWSQNGASATDTSASQDPLSPRARSATITQKNASPAGNSRFGFFTALRGLNQPAVVIPSDDELINLDIEAALFPTGLPEDQSAFSPAAFKNLQMTAIGLLTKYQAAFQQRTTEFRDLQGDCEAQVEEKEEVEMRVHHLKMQLEEMGRKADEREEVLQSVLQELAQEKRARAEELQMVRERRVPPSEISTVSEDLAAEEDQKRRSWRKSGATTKSDLSLDTDEESVDEISIFSRSRSPTIATSFSEASPIDPPSQQAKAMMPPPPRPQKQAPAQMTTFQKLFKGMSGENKDANGPNGCRNCQGQDASIAWDTVSLLRDENKGLKQRVGELETAVEGALDAVHGLSL